MDFKHHDKGILVYRGKRKRKNEGADKPIDNKSQNLKELHQTLCEDSVKGRYLAPERGSAVQLINTNKSKSRRQLSISRQSADKKNGSMNFYINIEKLKNLKITKDNRNSHDSQSNPYLKKQGVTFERKTALLKNYNFGKANNFHSEHNEPQVNRSLGQIVEYGTSKALKSRNNGRYKTHGNESVESMHYNPQSKPKKAPFKRAHNEQFIQDKSFIDGYLKGKQLGRGGFSKVWEGFHFKTKKFYAIKEIDTTNKYQTHLTEIWFGNYFFEDGVPKKEYSSHPGVNCLLRMYHYSIVDPRAFIVYESCDGSLGNMLYDIYEEDRDDDIDEEDKLYMIKYKSLYQELRNSSKFLRTMIYSIAQALNLLAENKIVHSDIKTENILIKKTQNNTFEFKLIDYGSSFSFESLKQYKLATPEYMCPELLNYILFENKKMHHEYMLSYVRTYENISAIDVWGLGCIVLELIHGLPLWLSNRTKILVNRKYETKKGLFAVSDRAFTKILEKQLFVVENFQNFLKRENNSGILIEQDLKELITDMLQPNPAKRIKPKEIIERIEQGGVY